VDDSVGRTPPVPQISNALGSIEGAPIEIRPLFELVSRAELELVSAMDRCNLLKYIRAEFSKNLCKTPE
jgi:hypothetical protein